MFKKLFLCSVSRNLFSASTAWIGIKQRHREIIGKGIIALTLFMIKANTLIMVMIISANSSMPPWRDLVVMTLMLTGRTLKGLWCLCVSLLIVLFLLISLSSAPRGPRQRMKLSYSLILFPNSL